MAERPLHATQAKKLLIKLEVQSDGQTRAPSKKSKTDHSAENQYQSHDFPLTPPLEALFEEKLLPSEGGGLRSSAPRPEPTFEQTESAIL